ncbi:DUF6884 domain-containing protein [Haloferax sulfurifontis]|uniref:DUF6884 domain-containing protein n=2 Tax=Haloferax sulfurifontis TaxID=255616 RepID=M0IMD9_9EURY|nr:DUF6884 domain-containing protein [Haloferax sulfurifontis]ELZ96629.1 hypothetical protein C441_04654 [Haloferax sulfurifontis ATCC BAA-897]GGC72330.1 hypothetical protein GCM10007209_37820 [Haloferax sulfurifontis]
MASEPTPREHELPNGDLAVSSHWVHGIRGVATVPASKRPLYQLLMDLLTDVRVPDLMPARLAIDCRDIVEARELVGDIDRGSVTVDGVSYGMGYCQSVAEAIDDYRDRDPLTLVAVGCSGSKHKNDGLLPAKDRYRGGYWTNKRQYAETIGDDWGVISAEYALLEPTEGIPDYERVPSDHRGVPVDHDGRLPSGDAVRTKLDLWAYEVHNHLSEWLDAAANGVDPRDVELQVLLGKKYEQPLRERGVFDALRVRGSLDVSFPFREVEGLTGIGKQRGWMVSEVDAATALATDGGESR